MTASPSHRVVALLSGGLDSLLAVKLIQQQGLDVLALHFVSPFFGKPDRVAHWESIHGVPIQTVDISASFVEMLVKRPQYGFGSVLNPCVDCKILMLRRARAIMEELGACCIISGEVLGQRPMSQRRDTLNIIRRDAGVRDCLLRPLCALHLEPTAAELGGYIDRSRLLDISGRGRKPQLELAARFGLREIPTPSGGCRLAERANARNYWPVLLHAPRPCARDFRLANAGRQYWHDHDLPRQSAFWLIIGRDQVDNDRLVALAGEGDLLFTLRDFPGPIALGRRLDQDWSREAIQSAAALTASYSPKCARHVKADGAQAAVSVHVDSLNNPGEVHLVHPCRSPLFAWREYSWAEAGEAVRIAMKKSS
jgi:hypothetical protein